LPIGRICVLQQNIPCSQDIVGDHLGVSGTPMCRLCGQGAHYHGECPTAWGNLGSLFQGFGLTARVRQRSGKETSQSPRRSLLG
jgi:hypothetical protein